MGGRGRPANLPPPMVPEPEQREAPSPIRQVQNLPELTGYMQDQYGVRVDTDSLQGAEINDLKHIFEGLEPVMRAFPDIARGLEIDGASIRSVSQNADYSDEQNKIRLNTFYLNPANGLQLSTYYDLQQLQSRQDDGKAVHPEGTDYSSHIVRAFAAKLCYQLARNGEDSTQAQAAAIKSMKYPKQVVNEAVRSVKRLPQFKGMKTADIIRDVSTGAAANRNATIMECVSDYAANRGNARPLSREVWRILKRELS